MTEHIRIDREYGFIDVWGFTRSQLEALNLPAIVIGAGCKGQLTVIPDQGANLKDITNTLQALEQPSTQPTAPKQVTPSTVVLPVIDSSHARKGTKGLENTGENATRARLEKSRNDEKRLQTQITQVRSLLRDQPTIGTTEMADKLGVSLPTARKLIRLAKDSSNRQDLPTYARQTVYNLRGLDDNDTIVLGSGTLKSAINESGLSSVESRRQPLAAQPIDPTVTVAANYTLSHSSGQPV